MKINLRDKRASHVSIIISMILFVSFVIFLILIIQPGIDKDKSKEFLVNSLEAKILEEISSNLTTILLVPVNEEDCVSLTSSDLEENISVRNDQGELRDFSEGSSGPVIKRNPGDKFFRVYSTEEKFNQYSGSFSCLSVSFSNITSYRESTEVFESLIEELVNHYDLDYDFLKSQIQFPEGSDFYFSFKLNSSTSLEPSPVGEPSTNVFAKVFPIKYISKNAEIKYGELTIKVW